MAAQQEKLGTSSKLCSNQPTAFSTVTVGMERRYGRNHRARHQQPPAKVQ